MKFSLSTSFAKLTLFTLLAVFLLTLGGRLVALEGGGPACAAWPLCLPEGLAGWAQLFHRFSVGLGSILVLALLFQAWRTQPDPR